MRKTIYYLKLAIIILVVSGLSFILNTYLSFDPYRIDPVPEVTANSLQPPDKQVPFRYFPVKLSEIPIDCQRGLVAIEDHNFYSNIGIDANGIIRGTFGELINYPAGGSTLTQQLVKNMAGTIYNQQFSVKLMQTLQAIRLNFAYSKDQILEMYFNSVYFGHYNYGIEAAAEEYFGKTIAQLNLAECAYMAGLPQSPSIYNPFANLSMGRTRQLQVLDAMLREGYITQQQKTAALKVSLDFIIH